MAQQSYPYDAGSGAAVNEAQWQAMARRFLATGVITGSLNQLAVSADGSALSVSVATGDAFVEGFFYRNDSTLALTISTANASNPRIDTVVVRLDRTANTAVLAVVTGTAAASPVAPTLSATDTLYELPLANVLVPAAAGVIVAGNVTDRRTLVKNLTEAAASAAYLALAATGAAVTAASESTTSTALTDLTTVGPAATVTVGASGRALVIVGAVVSVNTAGSFAQMSFAVSGATTRAADGNEGWLFTAPAGGNFAALSHATMVTGLTPGSNTFTAKYKVSGNTGTFSSRRIQVIPL